MHWKVTGAIVLLALWVGETATWGATKELQEAEQLEQQARMISKQGHYTQALPLLQKVLAVREKELGPENPDTAKALHNLASLYDDMGDYPRALPLYQRALAIREKTSGLEDLNTLVILNNLAVTYGNMGDYKQALSLQERVLAVHEKISGPEHLDTASALNNLAGSYFEMGDYTKALPLYQRVLAIREKALEPENPEIACTLNNLGSVYNRMGDYKQALQVYRKALAIREKIQGYQRCPDLGLLLGNLADIYREMHDYAQALPLAERALAIREESLGPEHPETAMLVGQLAEIHKGMGEFPQALPLYQRALGILEKSSPGHPVIASLTAGLAEVHRALGDYTQAMSLNQRAMSLLDSSLNIARPDLAPYFRNFHTALSHSGGDLTTILSTLEELVTVAEKKLPPESGQGAGAINLLAQMYEATGNDEKALQFFQRGIAREEYAFANVFAIASEQQKLTFAERSKWDYLAALSLIQKRFLEDEKAIRWGLDLVLRRKGIVLDAQARAQQNITANLQGKALSVWQTLVQHRSELSRLLLRDSGEQNAAENRRTIDQLRTSIAEDEESLAQRSGIAAQQLIQQRVTSHVLASHLPKESVLVEFVRLREFPPIVQKQLPANIVSLLSSRAPSRYLAFLLTPGDQVTLVVLGNADKLDAKIDESLAVLNDPALHEDLQAYTRRADVKLAELYELFIVPLEDALGAPRRLIVSPDGELSKVPFAALRAPDGHYLIEKMAVSYVASGRDLLRAGGEEPATVDLLLVANPAFDDRGALRTTAASENAVRAGDYGEHFDPLPGTAAEARLIPPLLTGKQQILQGKEASESTVRSIKSPKVLHLATHGFFLKDDEAPPPDALALSGLFDGELERGKGGITTIASGKPSATRPQINPMVRSGLALAGANHAKEITTGDDGILTALEVSGMNLYGTDLVVLSACETGLGDVQIGEGVYGLRRAFVLAGAKNLVMSLWAVNDKVTLDQMAEFYRGYTQGKSPAEALREAQLKSIASLREQTKATLGEALAPVRLWAPFIVQQTGESVGSRLLVVRTASYGWWNLIVPLLTMVGLLVLSRVRLNEVPAETTSTVIPVERAPQQSVPYARLVLRSPSDALPQEIVFTHDNILIGSGTECDVIIRHHSIARQHARVQWRKQGYVLCTVQGPQRTFVNGHPVVENLLKEGWVVRLGEVEFVFYDAGP